jgi:uncharacterized protein YndB with AHSA1/START domain
MVESAANAKSFEVNTPSEQEIRMTRLFDARPELVFDVMTTPAHVKSWWGRLGDGYSVPVCEIDLRVGGAWRFVNRHPQGEAAFYGEYREIARPDRLVFTETFAQYPDSPSLVSATFTKEGDKTRLTAAVRYPSRQVRDLVLGSGMTRGAAVSYDRLEDVLAELQKAELQRKGLQKE